MRRHLGQCLLTCLMAAATPAISRAQEAAADLFAAAREATPPVAFETPRLVRSRAVRVASSNIVEGEGMAGLGRRRDVRLGSDLRIAFFPDLIETFRRTGVEARQGGGFVWVGASRRGSVTLVVEGEGITGVAQLGARVLRIDQIRGSLHRVAELDPRAERPDIVIEHPSPPGRDSPTAEEVPLARREKSRIDVLVAYTPMAEKKSSNILADIDLAISLANQAYAASGVEIELKAVRAMRVDYDEGGSFQADLERLTKGEPPFNGVHKARDRARADLVSLIRKPGAFCGIANLVKRPSAATSESGFSVVSLDCIAGNHSFVHEIGHNMGLEHDRYWLDKITGRTPSDKQFGFGFVNAGAAIRDIMGYNDLCAKDGIYCTRVNMFSTPQETYQGQTIGIGKGKPGAADGARTLDQTRMVIEAYR